MSDLGDEKTQVLDGAGRPSPLGGNLMDVPPARLVCIESAQLDGALPGGGVLTLTPGREQVIGRDAGCSFAIPSRKLSRQHARIFGGVGTWGVEDLNSTNGVLVNKQRITTAWLKPGDEVRLGPVAFRYELEAAPAGATMAMPIAPSPADDGGERTMMIGSLSASKAVIEAARKSEPKQAPAAAAPPSRPAPVAAKPPREPVNVAKLAIFGVLGLLVVGIGAGGAIYYPIHQKQQSMEEVAAAGARVARIVIARARDLSGPGVDDSRYDEDVAAIRPALDHTWEVLATYPDEVPLAEVYARLRFLSFERSFAAAFRKGDLAEAKRLADDARARLVLIDRDLPTGPDVLAKHELPAAIDLLEFAELLVDLRAFADKYPQVKAGDDAPHPTKADITAFDGKRDQFIKLRRTYNESLSIDFKLFGKIVNDVEQRDLTLINHWREFLMATGG